MTIHFENNYYFNALKNTYIFDPDSFRVKPTFRDNEPTLKEYSRFYKDKGYIGRKITAIPQALWTGIVKTTFHLAKAIFICPSANSSKIVYFYVVARDLQEAFGRILCVFNDRVGLYHIQQARFYQTLYVYSPASENSSTQQRTNPTLENHRRQPASENSSTQKRTNPTLENLRRQFEAQQIETQRQLAEIEKRGHDQFKGSLKEKLESLSEQLKEYHIREMDPIPKEKREKYLAVFDPTPNIKTYINGSIDIALANGLIYESQVNEILSELRVEYTDPDYAFLEELRR